MAKATSIGNLARCNSRRDEQHSSNSELLVTWRRGASRAGIVMGTALLAAIAAISQAGCQSGPRSQSALGRGRHSQVARNSRTSATRPAALRPAGDQGPAQDDSITSGTAAALAMKARLYAQNLTPLIEQKLRPATNPSAGAVANAPAPAAPEPSAVEWSPTQGIRGGLLGALLAPKAHVSESPATPGVSVRPIIDASSAVNQGASLGTGGPAAAAPADSLEAKITQRAHDYPKEVWAQLDYQLLQFLEDQPAPKIDQLSELPTEDRELLTAVVDGLSNFRNALRADNNMLPSKKVRPILELADRLRAQADLSIPTICLCTRVDGFGVYEPIEPLRFEAGKDHQALIYCEIENFASQINEKKQWETRLTQEASLFTETGMLVWQNPTKPMVDESRDRRHDFYIVKRIKLPSNLTIGRYLLKVTIVDQQANRVAEATLPIQIVAQP